MRSCRTPGIATRRPGRGARRGAAKRGQMEPTEIIDVESEVIACDGGAGALGHPRVFLNMKGRGQVDCPYCGRRFVLEPESARTSADAAP